MRPRILILAALVAVGAQAQEAILLSQTRALTLPLLADDANTVAHVVWRDGALVDLKGNPWTQNGVVPQVARTPTMVAGAGPFSDLNYYSLGTGSDVLDFAGDFSACLVFASVALPAMNTVVLGDGLAVTAGYALQFGASGVARLGTYAGGTNRTVDTANAMVTNAVNVACYGRSGATANVRLNLGALASAAANTITPGAGYSAKIGRYENAGFSFGGTLYEAWFSTTTPSDALFTALMQRVKQRLGITAW